MIQWLLARAAFPSGLAGGSLRYCPPASDNLLTAETAARGVLAGARTAERLSVSLDAAPGAGNSLTVTLFRNGVATALTVTVSGTATGGEATGSLALAAGDALSYQLSWQGGSSPALAVRVALRVSGGDDRDGLLLGGSATNLSATATVYLAPGLVVAAATAEANQYFLVPDSGEILGFSVALSTAPGGAASYTLRLRKNGADAGDPLTISGSATAGSVTFAAPVSVSPGDVLTLSASPAGSPAAAIAWHGIAYRASAAHVAWYGGRAVTSPSTSTLNYNHPTNPLGWQSTARQLVVPDQALVSRFGIRISTAPGAGASWVFTVVGGAAGDTVLLTLSIADTATYGYTTGTASVQGAVGVRSQPANSPAAAGANAWSLTLRPILPVDGAAVLRGVGRLDGRSGVRAYWRQWYGPASAPAQIQLAPGQLIKRFGAHQPAKATITLAAGQNLIHGSGYAPDVGRVYLSTRTLPYWLLRLNPADLTYTAVQDSSGLIADDLAIVGDRVYVTVDQASGYPDNATLLDEYWTTDATPVRRARYHVGNYGRANAVAGAGNRLYVGTKPPAAGQGGYVLELSLPSLTVLAAYQVDVVSTVHGLAVETAWVWAATADPGHLYRLGRPGLTPVVRSGQAPSALTDDVAVTSAYVITGLELSPPRGAVAIWEKQGLNYEVVYAGSPSANCFGAWAEGDNWVWAVFDTSPGELARIDLTDRSFQRFWLSTGENRPNELVWVGTAPARAIVTCWLSPAKVVRLDNLVPPDQPIEMRVGQTRYSYWVPIRLWVERRPQNQIDQLRIWTDGSNDLAVQGEPAGARTLIGETATSYVEPTGVQGEYGDQLTTGSYPTLAAPPVEIWSWTQGSPKAIPGSLSGPPDGPADVGDWIVLQARASPQAVSGVSPAEWLQVWYYEDTAGTLNQFGADLNVVNISATLSGTGSCTATANATFGGAAQLAGAGGVSASGQRAVQGQAAVAGLGALTASGIRAATAAAALAGQGLTVAAAVLRLAGTAACAGSSALQATGIRAAIGAAALAGQGTLAASAIARRSASAVLAGAGAIAATAVVRYQGVAALAGAGALSASAAGGQVLGAAALTGAGALQAQGTRLSFGAAGLAGAGSVSTVATASRTAVVSCAGVGSLTASALALRAGAASLQGIGVLLAAAAGPALPRPLPAGRGRPILPAGRSRIVAEVSRSRPILTVRR